MPIARLATAERALPAVIARLVANVSVMIGAAIIGLMILMALLAPILASRSPTAIDPANRNRTPGTIQQIVGPDGSTVSQRSLMGTDSLGRDVFSRVIYGSRISLIVGGSVAALSAAIGLVLGLLAGYQRVLEVLI